MFYINIVISKLAFQFFSILFNLIKKLNYFKPDSVKFKFYIHLNQFLTMNNDIFFFL